MKHGPDSDSDNTASRHTIRLRGPCKLLWMRNGTQQAAIRVHIPCKIGLDSFEIAEFSSADTFVLQRNFGKPTGLEQSQSVTLELARFEGASRVAINRGNDEEFEFAYEGDEVSFDITSLLQKQNRFEVQFDSLPASAGEVQLSIQE